MPLQATSGAASYDAFGGGVPVAANYIEDVFSTWLYTGNGSTQTINNGIDLAGKGGLVWLKRRDGAVSHILFDTARSTGSGDPFLQTNTTDAQVGATTNYLSYLSNGFSLDSAASGINANQDLQVSWTFREQPKFFDVVTFTGNGSGSQFVNHNLQSSYGFIVIKRTDSTSDWFVLAKESSADSYWKLKLNSTAAYTGLFGADPNTNTGFFPSSVIGAAAVNGGTYVAYLFAHNAGGFGLSGTDNVISCGSYTGNGSAQDINLGYEAQWVLVKNVMTAGWDWYVIDNMRGFVVNPASPVFTKSLSPNTSGAESDLTAISPSSTGFRLNSSAGAFNQSGQTYIYIAIRRGPMRTPTTGTSVFQPVANTTTQQSPNVVGSLNADWFFARRINDATNWFQSSKLSPRTMPFNANNAEQTTQYVTFTNVGVRWIDTWSTTATTYRSYLFQRAPGFFDVVCYTGTGSARTVAHNLGVVPELMINKSRSNAADWWTYSAATGPTKYLSLNRTNAEDVSNTPWNNTAPTASVFSLGSAGSTNDSGYTYVQYLFASVPGVSKVGTYTGNGSSQTINCGFTGGARFVMVKRTDSTGNWMVVDTARGLVSAGDPTLYLNSASAEVTGVDWLDPDSSGFIVNQEGTMNANASGGTYIFLAIA